jgi:hypothetical protein
MSYMDFSSWPRDQEQSFVVYEQQSAESSKKAFTAAIIAGLAFLLLLVGIYAGVEPEHRDMTKDMNMSNLTKKTAAPKAEAPAPTPAPAAAPAAAPAPAPAPAAAPADKK